MKQVKRFMAALLTVALVIGLVPVPVKAEDGSPSTGNINLGEAKWQTDADGNLYYTFPDATVSLDTTETTGDLNTILCLSVDNDGSFKIPKVTFSDEDLICGIKYNKNAAKEDDKYTYTPVLKEGDILSSMTITKGSQITGERLQEFLRGLIFYRNGANNTKKQEISIITNNISLDDNMTALAVDGDVHYYKYIPYEDSGEENPPENNWYNAYNDAKSTTFDGMTGYLATITDENEQMFLFDSFGDNKTRAWLGGARTLTDTGKFTFDADHIDKDCLTPVDENGNTVQEWYWMCGPEAGQLFYTKAKADGIDDTSGNVEGVYVGWNREEEGNQGESIEPNNYDHVYGQYNDNRYSDRDQYGDQEYVLEYGVYEANWNDFNPYEVNRGPENNGIDGYIIEYSSYVKKNADGSTEAIKPDTSSVTCSEVIYYNKPVIDANDFIISKDELSGMEEDKLKETVIELSNAVRYEDESDKNKEDVTGSKEKVTVTDISPLTDKKNDETVGTIELELSDTTTTSGDTDATPIADSATVKISVVDKVNEGTDEDGSVIRLGANDFSISLEQAEAYANGEENADNMLKILANATATKNGKSVDRDDIQIKETSLRVAEGTYDVVFTYEGIDVAVTVTVKDNGNTTGDNEDVTDIPDDYINLTANNFEIETKSTTDNLEKLFEEKSNISAKKNDGTPVPYTIDSEDLENLKTQIENGNIAEVPVKITAGGKETTVTVTVFGYPIIKANDIIIKKDDTNYQDDKKEASVKEASNAKRYVTDDDDAGSDKLEADVSNLNVTESGESTITITDSSTDATAEGKTITATVVDETGTNQITDDDSTVTDIIIGANNFSLSVKQAQAFAEGKAGADTMIKLLANATATDTSISNNGKVNAADIKIIKNDSTKTNLIAEPSDTPYNVTFIYRGAEVTVKATVKGNGSSDDAVDDAVTDRIHPDNIADINLTANDITVPEDADTIDASTIIEMSNATANKNDGSPVGTITIDETSDQFKALKEAVEKGTEGTYPITITASENEVTVSTTITVTVNEKDNTTPTVEANDFIISKEDIPDNDDDAEDFVKKLADAGLVSSDGDKDPDKVDTDLTPLKETEHGTVDITFTDNTDESGTPQTETIQATVVDKTNDILNDDGTVKDIIIGANHISISLKQAEAYEAYKDGTDNQADNMLKILANAVATEKGTPVDRNQIEIDPENTTIAANTSEEPYKLTFTYTDAEGNTESVTVNVIVKDNSSTDNKENPTDVTDTDNNITITANDFEIEAGSDALTGQDILDKSKAEAVKNDGTKVTLTPDDISKEQLDSLNEKLKDTDTKEPEEVEITITKDDASITLKVTVIPIITGTDKDYYIENPNDITQELDEGKEVSGVTVNETPLEEDDYTVNDDGTITIKKEVFSDLEKGEDWPVVIDYTDGSKKEFHVHAVGDTTESTTESTTETTTESITESTTETPATTDGNNNTTAPTEVPADKPQTTEAPTGTQTGKPADTVGTDKIFEISNPKDITQDLDTGREVSGITVNGTSVPAGSYTVSGNTVTIKSSAFTGLKQGTYPAVITYKDGSKKTFNVKVVPYDEASVIKKVPTFNMQKDIGVGKKFKLNLVGRNANAVPQFKSSNKKIATINQKGVITARKKGKCTITASVIQNGSYYTVKIKLVVKKSMKMYNLKNKGLTKQSGILPEFNVYKRVVKGKKTKLKFTNVTKDAKVTYTTSNKKIATISNKGVIAGKKKGFAKITAKIEQNGYTYYTRLLVRVDDGTTNKELKKYLK